MFRCKVCEKDLLFTYDIVKDHVRQHKLSFPQYQVRRYLYLGKKINRKGKGEKGKGMRKEDREGIWKTKGRKLYKKSKRGRKKEKGKKNKATGKRFFC